jgi:NhaA family Na+:H+ antiporter
VRPLAGVLFLFGLTHGGVDLGAWSPTSTILLGSLWIGRPLGMIVAGVALALAFGLRLPPGVSLRNLLVIAVTLGLGFTVPVLAAGVHLPGGAMTEAARLGLAVSLLAGPAALLLVRLVGR